MLVSRVASVDYKYQMPEYLYDVYMRYWKSIQFSLPST
jgi:hypothetical protein